MQSPSPKQERKMKKKYIYQNSSQCRPHLLFLICRARHSTPLSTAALGDITGSLQWTSTPVSSAPRPSRPTTAPPARRTRGRRTELRAGGRCSCRATARRATPCSRTPASARRRRRGRRNPRWPRSSSLTRSSRHSRAAPTRQSALKCWKDCVATTCTRPKS